MSNALNNLSGLPTYLSYDDVLILPAYSEIGRSDVDVSTYLADIALKLPIIASPMDTVCEDGMALAMARVGGIGLIHRSQSIESQTAQVARVVAEECQVGAAVGLSDDFEVRSRTLVAAGASCICIDNTHGHSCAVGDAVRFLRALNIVVIAGNVATYDGARFLFEAGAQVLRVGKGAGSICVSRIAAGVGVPQFTTVSECARAAKEYGGYIIADGSVRAGGDIVKALAAGAHAVMIGSLFAGTDESPGERVELDEKMYKYYRGMGSLAAMKAGSADRYGQLHSKTMAAEGVEAYVPAIGPINAVIEKMMGGVTSGFVNVGARTIDELRAKAQFVRITSAGQHESGVHDVRQK